MEAHDAPTLSSAAFRSLPEASEFFAGGSTGFSRGRHHHLGVTLVTQEWRVRPMQVDAAESTFLADLVGPRAELDCAPSSPPCS